MPRGVFTVRMPILPACGPIRVPVGPVPAGCTPSGPPNRSPLAAGVPVWRAAASQKYGLDWTVHDESSCGWE